MKLEELTLEELKVIAYDELIKRNAAQQKLTIVENEINKREKED